MDQRGSLVNTNLKIYPSEKFIAFIKSIPTSDDVPQNILKYIDNSVEVSRKEQKEMLNSTQIQFTNTDIEMLKKIKLATANKTKPEKVETPDAKESLEAQTLSSSHNETADCKKDNENIQNEPEDDDDSKENNDKLFLTTSDIDWVYQHISVRKSKGEENVPYLHELFQETVLALPQNRVIKRNPVLEARCIKLRAQQEAREYRKMTKGVDNVRMRYPEDSISYQLKQVNRQLIAIGQFIISIFAGFLFGFRGVEWMVGNLEFGVRLLMGVMCALIIALAEIYFLAKKLNEELTMTETIQLGGPPKFANQPDRILNSTTLDNKEHQD